MKILIDQNISHRLIPHIQSSFPDIVHVREIGMASETDYRIFMYARDNSCDAILTLDEDFNHLNLVHGIPPKIIWLRVGNCSMVVLSEILSRNIQTIRRFFEDLDSDCLEIFNN